MAVTNEAGSKSGRILIVDDDASTRAFLSAVLAENFEVETACSGEDALAHLETNQADLVLMDVEMSGINGYETCRLLRKISTIPVIFVTAHDTLDDQIEAFDAGGNDIVLKPVDGEILKRKAMIAVKNKLESEQLTQEKSSLQQMAMSFLSNVGESGILLNFMRDSFKCVRHECLASKLIDATKEYGIDCHVMIRHKDGMIFSTPKGSPTPLEESILQQAALLGRVFQFNKRVVVNYDHVTLLAINMPVDDPEKMGRIRDHLAILTESAEAFSEVIEMRLQAEHRSKEFEESSVETLAAIETLHDNLKSTLFEAGIMIHQLGDDVSKTFSYLGMTRHQENVIEDNIRVSTQKVLQMLERGRLLDEQYFSKFFK